MIVYGVCILLALFGIALMFAGKDKNEPLIISGAALYFIALFIAAIHSIGTTP